MQWILTILGDLTVLKNCPGYKKHRISSRRDGVLGIVYYGCPEHYHSICICFSSLLFWYRPSVNRHIYMYICIYIHTFFRERSRADRVQC